MAFRSWDLMNGLTRSTFFRHVALNTAGPLEIISIDRKSTAFESINDFFSIVPDAIINGKLKGKDIPPTALFEMKGVGIVVRDRNGKKLGNNWNNWDLYAQDDIAGMIHINVWAVEKGGKCVAKTEHPRISSDQLHLGQIPTQKFTFADQNNAEIVPNILNMNINWEIIFLDMMEGGKETKIKIEEESAETIKMLCAKYAEEVGKDLKSLRFSYADKSLFLSSVGKQLPAQLDMVNNDVILVTYNTHNDEADGANTATTSKGKKKKKGKGGGKKKKKSGPRPVIEVKKSDKEEHSKVFSHVLNEAEPIFKRIREKLHALNLERTPPKQKESSNKHNVAAQEKPVFNPSNDDQVGKAGKSYYVVLVGEVTNLYKSGSFPKQRARSLDLHGLTTEEALAKLNENLSKWVDVAMQGSYPFVIPVALVCGGGNQVLSEAVGKWIKSKDQVANAPKNYFTT